MIMNGMQHTNVRDRAHGYKVLATILVVMLIFSGCSSAWLGLALLGDGQGDWEKEIFGGYSIVRINSREIVLAYKESPSDVGHSFAMENNYFITAYQAQEPYIFLEGIETQEWSISDEERENGVLCYYLCNTTDGEIVGPFTSKAAFTKYCASLEIELADAWIQTESVGKKAR